MENAESRLFTEFKFSDEFVAKIMHPTPAKNSNAVKTLLKSTMTLIMTENMKKLEKCISDNMRFVDNTKPFDKTFTCGHDFIKKAVFTYKSDPLKIVDVNFEDFDQGFGMPCKEEYDMFKKYGYFEHAFKNIGLSRFIPKQSPIDSSTLKQPQNTYVMHNDNNDSSYNMDTGLVTIRMSNIPPTYMGMRL